MFIEALLFMIYGQGQRLCLDSREAVSTRLSTHGDQSERRPAGWQWILCVPLKNLTLQDAVSLATLFLGGFRQFLARWPFSPHRKQVILLLLSGVWVATGFKRHSLFSLANHLLLEWPNFPQKPHLGTALPSALYRSCFDVIALSSTKAVSAISSKLR
jgi:hypothetical protein